MKLHGIPVLASLRLFFFKKENDVNTKTVGDFKTTN